MRIYIKEIFIVYYKNLVLEIIDIFLVRNQERLNFFKSKMNSVLKFHSDDAKEDAIHINEKLSNYTIKDSYNNILLFSIK